MPLYNQQTNLSGRGNAPTVQYYAGIKAPTPKMPEFPKGEYKFNIDLSRIGDAMIASSRDKKETELGLAKIQAAKEEKELQRQQKQLETDVSNAYAKAIADIAAEVDQGRTDPLTANRRMRSVDDQFRALGYMSASTMSSIRNSWDGGIGDYQKNTREQYRKAENDYKIGIINDVRSKLPAANNWSNEETFSYGVQKEYLANRARDSLNKFNMLPSEATRSIAVKDQQAVSDAQAQSVILNSFGTNLSPTQMYQNVYTMTYDNAIANGWSEEEAADMANRALEVSKPTIELLEAGTEKDKKFWEDKLSSETAKGKYMVFEADPVGYMQTVMPNYDIAGERAQRDPATRKLSYIEQPKRELGRFEDITIKSETDTSATATTIPGDLNGIVTTSNGRTYVYNPDTVDTNADKAISDEEWMSAILNGQVSGGIFTRPKINRTIQQCQGPECGRNGSYATTSDENKQIIKSNTTGMAGFASNGNTQKAVKEQSDIDGIEYSLDPTDLNAAAKAQNVFDNNPDLVKLANEPKTRALSVRNASNQWVLTDQGRLMLSDTATTFGEGEVSRVFTNYADMPQVQKINKAVQNLPYSAKVKKEIIRGMVSNNGKMIPDWNPEIHGDLRASATVAEKVFGNITETGSKAWRKANSATRATSEFLTNTSMEFWDWYINNMKSPGTDGLTGEQKAKIAMGVLFNGTMFDQFYTNLVDMFNKKEQQSSLDSEGIKTDNFEKEVGRKVESGTIDINSTEDLPIKFNEDGTWSNFKYATIGADGWTYLVPTINMSAKEALEANKYIARFEGEDARAVNNAEQFGQRVRQYLIDKYSAFTEPSGGLENISNLSKNLPENPWLNIEETPQNLQSPEEVKTALKLESKTKEELKNTVLKNIEEYESFEKLGEDIIKASNDTIKDISDALDETGYRPLNNEEAAKLGFTLFKDKNVVDEWLKVYNNLGKKSFGNVRQALYVASSIPPGVLGAVGAGVYKLGSLGGEGIAWLQVAPGLYIPTSKEREFNKEMLEAVKNIKIVSPKAKALEEPDTTYYQNIYQSIQ